jgi:hypothetical protein
VRDDRATFPDFPHRRHIECVEEVMSRSKRRVAHRRRNARAEPRRYHDGTVIPAELLELIPPDPPVSFIGGLDHIGIIAVEVFSQLPTLEHAVLIVDVLGGVHAVRCFEELRGLRLPEVADRVVLEVEDLLYPMSLLYLTRGHGFPADASTLWNELLGRHAGPPFLADAVVVAAKDGRIWSYAERFARAVSVPRDN